jgi:hypothetical protein
MVQPLQGCETQGAREQNGTKPQQLDVTRRGKENEDPNKSAPRLHGREGSNQSKASLSWILNSEHILASGADKPVPSTE